MLLNSCDVNLQREQRGQLTVNSVWLWGEGLMPKIAEPQWDLAVSSHPVVASLAELSGTRIESHLEQIDVLSWIRSEQAEHCLYVMNYPEQWESLEQWADKARILELHWFQPLHLAMQSGYLNEVVIDTGLGMQFSIQRGRSWTFWKRQKHFADYINAG